MPTPLLAIAPLLAVLAAEPSRCHPSPASVDGGVRSVLVVGDSVVASEAGGAPRVDLDDAWQVEVTCWDPETGRFSAADGGIPVVRVTTSAEMERLGRVVDDLAATVSMAAADGAALTRRPHRTRYPDISAEVFGEGEEWRLEVEGPSQRCTVHAGTRHLAAQADGVHQLCSPYPDRQVAALRAWYREKGGGVTSLRGQLLVSSGGLYDPNFRHTVVLIGEHDADGALGVVLNRPTPMEVAEVVPPLAELVGPGEPIFRGGPVQPSSPVLLAELTTPDLADLPIFEGVGFLTGEVSDSIRPAVLRARVFAGYSGWGPGQLERELAEDSWIVDPARVDDVFTGDPESLWRRILERKGPDFRQMSRVPFDPRTN